MQKGQSARDIAIGSGAVGYRSVAAAATVTPKDRVILVDCSATFTLTLCSPSEFPADTFLYIKGVGTGGAVTVSTPVGGLLATPKFTVDDLTAATDYKLLLNVAGIEWMEIAEVTT
jgi:hypothetical protein